MKKKYFVGAAAVCLVFFLAIPFMAATVGCITSENEIGEFLRGREADSVANKGEEDAEKSTNEGLVKTPNEIKVWKENEGKVVSVDFEEYVACVAASEMPCSFESEALKAQSVATRTFAMSKLEKYKQKKPTAHPDAPVCSSTHCQVYKTEEELIACHPDDWGTSKDGFKKVKRACEETEGQLLYYDGQLVMQPLFFSSSGGQTENSEDVFVSAVPYLVSVSSPYEEEATHRNEEKSFTLHEFKEKIKAAFPEKDFGSIVRENICVLSRTAGGRVDKMQIGDVTLKGTEVRNAFGLSSAFFSVSFEQHEGKGEKGDKDNQTKIVFTSSGSGHGVGMSQYGANGMAKRGADYKKILTYYYSGTEVR